MTGDLCQNSDGHFTEKKSERGQSSEPWRLALGILCLAPSLTQGTWHVWRRWRRATPAFLLTHLLVEAPPLGQASPLIMSSMCGRSQTVPAQSTRTETGNQNLIFRATPTLPR